MLALGWEALAMRLGFITAHGCVSISHQICNTAPFIQHFHNNCTMDDFKNPMEIQSFILQDKLQLLGMEQFCWILYIVKILGIKLFPNTFTMLWWIDRYFNFKQECPISYVGTLYIISLYKVPGRAATMAV